MEGRVAAGREEKKKGRKRPASLTDGEEVKSAKAKNIDDEVEEFFALLRNMREASRFLGKGNPSNPSFRPEDLPDIRHGGGGGGGEYSSAAGGGGRGRETGRPSRSKLYGAGNEKEARWEGSEDNGLPTRLDLNVGPCSGSSQYRLPKCRGARSAMEESEDE